MHTSFNFLHSSLPRVLRRLLLMFYFCCCKRIPAGPQNIPTLSGYESLIYCFKKRSHWLPWVKLDKPSLANVSLSMESRQNWRVFQSVCQFTPKGLTKFMLNCWIVDTVLENIDIQNMLYLRQKLITLRIVIFFSIKALWHGVIVPWATYRMTSYVYPF